MDYRQIEERHGYRRRVSERGGLGGARRGPHGLSGNRGAPRLRRGASERGGLGGPVEAPTDYREIEERHGCAGALPSAGGLGGPSRPPRTIGKSRSATAAPGRFRARGAWGARR